MWRKKEDNMSGIPVDDPDFPYLCVDRKQLQKEQTQTFDSKKNVWVTDEKEGFVKAEIQSTKGDDVTVLTEKMAVSPIDHSVSIPPFWNLH